MELKHLEEFVALAKSLNFSETASDLHLAQPTLSKHMALLETDLGAKLFKRSSTNVELTEEGFYFLGTATNVIGQLDQAKKDLALLQSREPLLLYVEGRLEDAAITSMVSHVSSITEEKGLPPIVLSHNTSEAPLTLLLEGDIDLFIDILPLHHDLPDTVACHALFNRPFVVIMDADHPLAAKKSLRIADLKDATLVSLLWNSYQPGWKRIKELCAKNGFEPKCKSVAVRSMAESLMALPKGCLLLYPAAMKELKYLERSSNRRCLPIEDDDAVFTTYVLYRKDSEEKVAPFLELFDQAMSLVVES